METRPLRFQCLLLDHDDTTVRGTEEVHYPAHVEVMRQLRPGTEACSLNEWFSANHNPGIMSYLTSMFDTEEMKREHVIWNEAMAQRSPSFYEGMAELLAKFKAAGGRIAVVSHSPANVIEQHYKHHPLASEIQPDLIFGWDADAAKRKPSAAPALEVMQRLALRADQCLVLDDLAPGVKMARSAGVAVAGSGWGHSIPEIEEFMRRECDFYFNTVGEFADFLFDPVQTPVPAL